MKLNTLLMTVSALTTMVAFWQRDNLPADIPLVAAAANEPVQRRARSAPFAVDWNNQSYTVEPQYDYDLTGLIVSFRHQDGNSRMHRRANDQLNMLDVCVVWGETAASPLLNRIDFWNGVFTCNFQTRDSDAWASFDIYQISNNHLISADASIRDAVSDIRIGDQIRVRGKLASYVSPGGGRRGTSTTRTDTGNGACETIYVEQFQILRAGVSLWRYAMYVALGILVLTLLRHFTTPHRPY